MSTPGRGTPAGTLVDSEKEDLPSDPSVAMNHSSETQKPNFVQRITTNLGLDLPTFLMMLKGAMPPIIALAAYQSHAYSSEYTTLGFLTAILAFLSLAILPRAKYFQGLVISLFLICFSAAISLLQFQCAVSARLNSTPTPQPTAQGSSGGSQAVQYNASASAVAAVWFFFEIYLISCVRAARPQIMIQCIQGAIFVTVASTYAPTMPNMDAGMRFVKRLLVTFLTGYGIATGVNLIVFPVTTRMIVEKQFAGVLGMLKSSLAIPSPLLNGIARSQTVPESQDDNKAVRVKSINGPSMTSASGDAKKMKETLRQLGGLLSELKINIGFAKKEIAYGKFCPEDYSHIFEHVRQIFLPVAGLSTFIDIVQSVKEHKSESQEVIPDLETLAAVRHLEAAEWDEVIALSGESVPKVKSALITGLTHASYVLELVPKPKTPKADIEKTANAPPAPGTPEFTLHFKLQMEEFYQSRKDTMKTWCQRKGLDVPSQFWEDTSVEYSEKDVEAMASGVRYKHNQQQLYLVLYLEYLLSSVCKATLAMVNFADSKVKDGTMSKKRFIFPGWKRIRKLIGSVIVDSSSDKGYSESGDGVYIYVGDALKRHKDPEHLPPSNIYQRVTEHLRAVPRFLASDESAYGFRVALASISLGILAYLRQTARFYLTQRGVWAVIMVAISMGPHAGAGVQGLVARVVGSTIATVAAIALWYIGDQKPAAVIPLFYLYLVVGVYFILKKPKHLITAVIALVTVILIIGYELQDLQIGTRLLESNGQEFYKIYILAPIRLLTVVIGLGAAFIWTYIPYPITTHSTLRKDLGQTLYLLANYHAVVHSSLDARLQHSGTFTNSKDKTSPFSRLDKARARLLDSLIAMLGQLRQHSEFTRYEPTFGGKFPKHTYDELISHTSALFNYITLIAYSSNAFSSSSSSSGEGASESQWLADFRRLASGLSLLSHTLTSTLCLVSASISNSQPLPPYIEKPPPMDIAARLSSVDPGILSTSHIDEPCYAAFAVLEVAGVLATRELEHVVAGVRALVGEVDFRVRIGASTLSGQTVDDTNGSDANGKGKLA